MVCIDQVHEHEPCIQCTCTCKIMLNFLFLIFAHFAQHNQSCLVNLVGDGHLQFQFDSWIVYLSQFSSDVLPENGVLVFLVVHFLKNGCDLCVQFFILFLLPLPFGMGRWCAGTILWCRVFTAVTAPWFISVHDGISLLVKLLSWISHLRCWWAICSYNVISNLNLKMCKNTYCS